MNDTTQPIRQELFIMGDITREGDLLAHIDAAILDAARMDWLDRELACPLKLHDGRSLNLSDKGLRHVIDAAMKGAK